MGMPIVEMAFRVLRKEWFDSQLRSEPQHRVWEDDSVTKMRDRQNQEMWELYDQQTQEIIAGEDRPIAPRCHNDLVRGMI